MTYQRIVGVADIRLRNQYDVSILLDLQVPAIYKSAVSVSNHIPLSTSSRITLCEMLRPTIDKLNSAMSVLNLVEGEDFHDG